MSKGHTHQRVSIKGGTTSAGEAQLAVVGERFDGPVPDPRLLAQYESVLPGAAERIFKMAEQEQRHRHTCDETLLAEEIRNGKRMAWLHLSGQICGVIIGFGGISAGAWLTYLGKDIAGISTLVGCLGTLIGAFFFKRKTAEKIPPPLTQK